jgi:hypothetical protein
MPAARVHQRRAWQLGPHHGTFSRCGDRRARRLSRDTDKVTCEECLRHITEDVLQALHQGRLFPPPAAQVNRLKAVAYANALELLRAQHEDEFGRLLEAEMVRRLAAEDVQVDA